MKPIPGNTALLLFTRTPREEVRHKQLLGKGKKHLQKQLFRKLVDHARQLGQQCGLPFFIIDSQAQEGQNFGERFYQALATVFSQGFTKVIAIGNDCIQLQNADIIHTAAILQNQEAVFGPALDGGIYLLGIDKNLFSRKAGFLQINWQTPTVLEELQAWARETRTLTLDKVYEDLDSAKALQKAFYQAWLPSSVLALLATFFAPLVYLNIRFIYRVRRRFISALTLRGPPSFLNF